MHPLFSRGMLICWISSKLFNTFSLSANDVNLRHDGVVDCSGSSVLHRQNHQQISFFIEKEENLLQNRTLFFVFLLKLMVRNRVEKLEITQMKNRLSFLKGLTTISVRRHSVKKQGSSKCQSCECNTLG